MDDGRETEPMTIRTRLILAALAMSILSAPEAGASPALEPSRLGLEASSPLTLALAQVPAPADVEIAGVHYRPRSRGYYSRRQPESSGVSQLHVGFFDPDGDQSSRLGLGVRGGPMIDRMVQLGLGVDWIHKNENISTVSSTQPGPGGVPIEVKQDIARASVNMFPIMGFVQVQGPDDMGIIPYFGAGGGWQVMLLSGDDFQTGESFEGTFSGWGWQLWGGVGFPLGGRTRLNGEVYVNGAELGRDATDPNTGQKVHETVKGDGIGMRFGLAWGF
jgi:hypothetical protein